MTHLSDLFDAHGIPLVLESASGLYGTGRYGTRGVRERLTHSFTAVAGDRRDGAPSVGAHGYRSSEAVRGGDPGRDRGR